MTVDVLKDLIAANLNRATAQRVRSLFAEINPHLVGDALFESRWSDVRKDAAVLVPIIPRREGATVLLTVRSSDMPSHAGQISFPGGRTHPEDATPVDTALRETEEEVGIPRHAVDVVGALGVHQGGLGYSVTPVVGIVDPTVRFALCDREVAEAFEVPLDFVADLSNHVTERRSHKGVDYNMFAAPYGRYHIWGLTAGILRTLAETLQADERPLADRSG
ncbi:MAG: CoA pyrophosphatase [Alphaproteobacteria bacterium]|nr:CoA pyrophosphatase [Alphaproteobacteria bacterium]